MQPSECHSHDCFGRGVQPSKWVSKALQEPGRANSAQPSPCLCHAGQARQAWIPEQPGKGWKVFSGSPYSVSVHTNLKPSLSENPMRKAQIVENLSKGSTQPQKSIPGQKGQLLIAVLVKGKLLPEGCKACGDSWGSAAILLLQGSPSRTFQVFINYGGHNKQSRIIKLADHTGKQLSIQHWTISPKTELQLYACFYHLTIPHQTKHHGLHLAFCLHHMAVRGQMRTHILHV